MRLLGTLSIAAVTALTACPAPPPAAPAGPIVAARLAETGGSAKGDFGAPSWRRWRC